MPSTRAVRAAILACLALAASAALAAAPKPRPVPAVPSPSTAAPPPGASPVERVRALIDDGGGATRWGADPPLAEVDERAPVVGATVIEGAGHSMILLGKEGRPLGRQLVLRHVEVGTRAEVIECVLRTGREDRSCPPRPSAVVDCTSWEVDPAVARAVLVEARRTLFVRVFAKEFLSDPPEVYEDGRLPGMSGSGGGSFSSGDFATAVQIIEAARDGRVRVYDHWAGYPSDSAVGRYARARAAAELLGVRLRKPGAPSAEPGATEPLLPPALREVIKKEFSRMFAALPLGGDGWWWVRERMALMAGHLGGPKEVAALAGWLAPPSPGPSELRTRTNALEALARLTGVDTRCDGLTRRDDAAAATEWLRRRPR